MDRPDAVASSPTHRSMLLSAPASRRDPHPTEDREEPRPAEAARRGGRPSIDGARAVLQEVWGYSDFRPGQEEAIASVLGGTDTLAILPTGAGKSIVYQLSSLLFEGTTIVVSPLISLMKDQLDGLARRGIPSAYINSSLTNKQMRERLLAAEEGRLKLLYIAPERFDSLEFRQRIARVRVPLYAIDEAHCVSEWGQDFRRSYTRLSRYRELLGNPPILALTATATPEVRADIVRILGLVDPEVQIHGFDRPNLTWSVIPTPTDAAKVPHLKRLLRGLQGSAVVYASTRRGVETIVRTLVDAGFAALSYHAGLAAKDRKNVQESFMNGRVPIVVATNAFGMGVDKADVRIVIHYNFPGTLESYYQEAGRAGRDGAAARCVLLYTPKDAATHEFLTELSHPKRHWYGLVYPALRKAIGEDGRLHISQAELARQNNWPASNPLSAVLRNLHEAGIVKHTPRGREGLLITLTKSSEQIKLNLAPTSRDEDRALLREIWRLAGGPALYQGALLRPEAIESLPDGLQGVRKALTRLARDGILSFEEEERGTRLLKRYLNPRFLPLDWESLERRRQQEYEKLRRVQAYAESRECRRGHLLRYFGDPDAEDRCGACDNCE